MLGRKDGWPHPGWGGDPPESLWKGDDPSRCPCPCGWCFITGVPLQALLSRPTVCSIKLNFPSVFNGLLICKDWAIVFQAPSAGGEEESLTCCLPGYRIDKTPCLPPGYCELMTRSPHVSLVSPHVMATADRFRGNAVLGRRKEECL